MGTGQQLASQTSAGELDGVFRGVARYGAGGPEVAIIQHGYYYQWVNPDHSDNRLNVGFDADTNRAYWHYSSR